MDIALEGQKKSIKQISLSYVLDAIVLACVVLGVYYTPFNYVAMLLICFSIAVLSREESFILLLLLFPFATIFKLGVNEQSLFTYVQLFACLAYLVKGCKFKRAQLITFMLLAAYLLLTAELNYTRYIKFFAGLLLIMCFVSFDKRFYKHFAIAFIIGFLLSSTLGLFVESSARLSAFVDVKVSGGFVRFAGLNNDPNYYAINIVLSLVLSILLYVKKEINFAFYPLFTVFIAFGVLTNSKSFLLMLVVVCLVFLVILVKRKEYLKLTFFAVLFVAGLVYIAIDAENFFSDIVTRFTESLDRGNVTTGRSTKWFYYFDYIFNNIKVLFFGAGLSAGLVNEFASHNTYIDSIYYFGIVGTTILIALLVQIFKAREGGFKLRIENFSGLLVIAMMVFFLSCFLYYELYYQLIVAYMICNINFNKTEPLGLVQAQSLEDAPLEIRQL